MSIGDTEPLGRDVRRDMRRLLGPTAFGAILVAGLAGAAPSSASDTGGYPVLDAVQPAAGPGVAEAVEAPQVPLAPEPETPARSAIAAAAVEPAGEAWSNGRPEMRPNRQEEEERPGLPASEVWPSVPAARDEPRRVRGPSFGDEGGPARWASEMGWSRPDRRRGHDEERTRYFDPAGLSQQQVDALLSTNGDALAPVRHDRRDHRRRRHEARRLDDLASLLPGGTAWPSVVAAEDDVRRVGLDAPGQLPDDDNFWEDLLARADHEARELLEEIGPLVWPAVEES